MCAIIGIIATSSVNQSLYDGLTVLQHRGQDAAGIVTCDAKGKFYLRKDNGLVRDVFRSRHMLNLRGNMGIGHARYPTAGRSNSAEAQPFYVNSPFGIALAHNGNLTNSEQLKQELFIEDRRHINTDSDTEILLNVFAHELQAQGKLKINERDIFNAVAGVHRRCRGSYAVVVLIAGYGIVGFRDPYGIRPVVFGKRDLATGSEYIIASESVALDSLDFQRIRDIAPGEAVAVDVEGGLHIQQCAENPVYAPCIFEYVYLARPDSIIDDVSVYKARLRMGDKLADKILREWSDHDIDVVIPIPDTSRTAALQLANRLNITYREGFIKNRYIGRLSSCRDKRNAKNPCVKNSILLLSNSSVKMCCWLMTRLCAVLLRNKSSRWPVKRGPVKFISLQRRRQCVIRMFMALTCPPLPSLSLMAEVMQKSQQKSAPTV